MFPFLVVKLARYQLVLEIFFNLGYLEVNLPLSPEDPKSFGGFLTGCGFRIRKGLYINF